MILAHPIRHTVQIVLCRVCVCDNNNNIIVIIYNYIKGRLKKKTRKIIIRMVPNVTRVVNCIGRGIGDISKRQTIILLWYRIGFTQRTTMAQLWVK